MGERNIIQNMQVLIEGIDCFTRAAYLGLYISKAVLKSDKNLIVIGHSAPFHNVLWETFKQEFSNTFINFGISFDADYTQVEIETFDLSTRASGKKNPFPLNVVFQMPLVVNDIVIGALVLVDSAEKELTHEQLTIIGLLADQFSVICENRLLIEEIQELAITDGLTRLFNRRHTMQRLSDEFIRARRYYVPLCTIMADADHFKYVNDTYGHQAGDKVLFELGKIFMKSIRSTDIVGRYGGEEFLFVLPHTDVTGGVKLVERIQKEIKKELFKFNGKSVRLTLSYGISGYPNPHITSCESLIDSVDKALYDAKEAGRNTVKIFEEGLANSIEYLI